MWLGISWSLCSCELFDMFLVGKHKQREQSEPDEHRQPKARVATCPTTAKFTTVSSCVP